MQVNIFLFDDFETMDVFGPTEIFGRIPEHFHIRYLSWQGGIVNSSQGAKIWTEELNVSDLKDILIIPGGRGVKKLLHLEMEITEILKKAVQKVDRCLLVENGSAILAKTGILFRRQIADYNYGENWKRMFTVGINHVPDVKWIADGKFYSCSSPVTSMDMSLGVVADMIDIEVAQIIAEEIGYQWDADDADIIF